MTALYLDVCALGRPFDDQSQGRIRLEAEAVYLILSAIVQGKYQMMTSAVHLAEITANSDGEERLHLLSQMNQYGRIGTINAHLAEQRAEVLRRLQFGTSDAAHLAVAEQIANVFLTTDNALLKKCRRDRVCVPAMNPALGSMFKKTCNKSLTQK